MPAKNMSPCIVTEAPVPDNQARKLAGLAGPAETAGSDCQAVNKFLSINKILILAWKIIIIYTNSNLRGRSVGEVLVDS